MRRISETLGWFGSSALLFAIPKCPGCVAAYVALWTGLGLSMTAASYLRGAAIAVATLAMVFLAIYRMRRFRRRHSAQSPSHCKCNH